MKNISENSIGEFIGELSSKEPVPGGGGASALIGAVGAALCSMVANLTSGKKKYAEFQEDIDQILIHTGEAIQRIIKLADEDAEVFEPLADAYRIPKEDLRRDEILENALITACSVPMKILNEVLGVVNAVEELYVKGSRLALSDIGVAASACRCSMESAIMNIYINTNLMKNHKHALAINSEAENIFIDGINRCNLIYSKITDELKLKS